MRTKRNSLLWTALAVSMVLALATAALAGSSSTNLPGGAALTVSIDSPTTSTEFLIPGGSDTRNVTVAGKASVGQGQPNATMVYVMDVSGSTDEGGGTGCSPILGCEKNFVNNLNAAVITTGSVAHAGVVVFADNAAAADMAPDAGDQLLVAPDADGYVGTVVNSAFSDAGGGDGGVTQYALRQVGQFTNFAAGLQSALAVVSSSSDLTKAVVFMSDGLSNRGTIAGFNNALAGLVAQGAVIQSIAVGAGSNCTGGDVGTLQAMADATGGTCYEVTDPGTLPDIIPDLVQPYLDSLALGVDGAAVPSPFTTSKPLPMPGADELSYETTAPGLAPGDHELCVTANGSDTLGTASVTQCEVIHLYQLTLAPDGVVNELGTPGQGHEVMATLLGPLGGLAPVGGRTIDFAVVSGPNMGAAGSDTTDADGDASFSYTATQGPAGLGTDSIQACVTLNDPLGETGCTSVSKDWVDTTPPVPACTPSVNPHGNEPKAPGQGGQGQNQDGFYELSAEDAVWPPDTLAIYVMDTGSGTVWGPFPVGTSIKYIEDPDGEPSIEAMGGNNDGNGNSAQEVEWRIKGTGDAAVYAVDGSNNVSDPVFCLVPPPPM